MVHGNKDCQCRRDGSAPQLIYGFNATSIKIPIILLFLLFVSFYAVWQVVFNIYKKEKGSQMAKILEKKVLLGGCGGEAAPDSEETSWKVVAIKTVWCWHRNSLRAWTQTRLYLETWWVTPCGRN